MTVQTTGWIGRLLRRIEYTVGFVWLNVYSILALILGIVFMAWVPQVQDIIANLLPPPEAERAADARHGFHLAAYLAAAFGWAAAIWYSMRVLTGTRFPRQPEPHPLALQWANLLREEFPRLAAFAALVVVAFVTSVFLAERPTVGWLPYLAIGLLPVAWATAYVGNRIFRFRGLASGSGHYGYSIVAIALLALGLALNSWISAMDEGRGLLSIFGFSRDPAGNLRGALIPELVPGWPGALLGLSALASLAGLAVGRPLWKDLARGIAVVAWLGAIVLASSRAALWTPLALEVLAGAGLWYMSCRRALYGIAKPASVAGPEVARATWIALWLVIGLLAALIIGFSNAPIALGKYLGTLAIVFLALLLWCFFGTVLWVFLPMRKGWASLAALPLLWALFIGQSAHHELRATGFDEDRRESVRLHFSEWRKRLPDPDRSPIIFVAASGGGLRAGFWAAHALAAADDETCGEFGRHVYAYSSVSGGSLGVAAYLSQRQAWAAKPPQERCAKGRLQEMTKLLGRDFLAPVAGSMLFAEAFQLFFPISYLSNERGAALADGWRDAWNETFPKDEGRFARTMIEALPADAANPAVLFNATAVNSGRRIVASNVVAALPGVDDLFQSSLISRDVRLKTHGLPLSDAVLNSARFTYVSPAGTVLGCQQSFDGGRPVCRDSDVRVWDRLVDGGYFENSGLATLRDVMKDLRTDFPPDSRGYGNPVFTLLIENSRDVPPICPPAWKNANLRDEKTHDMRARGAQIIMMSMQGLPVPSGKLPALSETTAPLEALLNVREARAALEMQRVRSEVYCRYVIDWSLREYLMRTNLREPPLGWFLSAKSAQNMVQAARANAASLPFTLVTCDDGKSRTRGIIGDRKALPPACPKS
jgi:hypothetical protein